MENEMIKQIEKEAWNLNSIQTNSRSKFIAWINENNKLVEISSCPNCDSKQFKQICNVDRFGLNFNSLQCSNCKLITTSPQIKKEYLPEYYNTFYHPLIFGEIEAKEYLFDSTQGAKIFKILLPFLKDRKQLKVFEIGAGSGSNLKGFSDIAKKYGIKCSLEGLEFSEKYVKKALEFDIKLYAKPIEEFSAQINDKYDIFILSHVFEHVNNLDDFLSHVKKMINDDTLVYIEVPGVLTLHKNNAYNCSFKRYLVHAHLYQFTAETLKIILEKNSFQTIYINEMVESVFMLENKDMQNKKIHSDVVSYLENLQNYRFMYCLVNVFKRIKNKIQKFHL
jgi:2-polyprenyl-3-methyl-5-hydroxy-6-metoxy-1,4-benzoquinol methylase